ncbi:unnamed protein product [Boreogadus saida]
MEGSEPGPPCSIGGRSGTAVSGKLPILELGVSGRGQRAGYKDLNLQFGAEQLEEVGFNGVGPALQKPFSQYLDAQRNKLHHAGEGTPAGENWLSWVFEKVVLVMVVYFVCSIVNSMAQSYGKRLQQRRHSEEKTK